MSRRSTATAAQLWSVLSDGWSYASWVVGAAHIRDVDLEWPARGSRLHHSVGAWPLVVSDTTQVIHAEDNLALTLYARAQPVAGARVQLLLDEQPTGTTITMKEDLTHGPGCLLPAPLRWALIAPRNVECLRRLAALAERRSR